MKMTIPLEVVMGEVRSGQRAAGGRGVSHEGEQHTAMAEECKGGIQPMSQERRHVGGKPGRASVTCSPDSGGIHSLIGVIDPPRPLCYFFG